MNYGRTLEGYEADIRLLAQPRATGQKPGSFMISITPAVSIRVSRSSVAGPSELVFSENARELKVCRSSSPLSVTRCNNAIG